MANGPLGGFMPTPPSPGQPPQVKLETSAESRGAFNKFLGTLPSNGAIAPIQTGVVPSSTAPVTPMTGNVNIFQPQMSQMAPMPIMPPAQPVQNFFMGGAAMSGGGFSDADIGSQIDSFDDNQQSFVDDDPVAGFDFDEDTGSFDVVSSPDVSESEQQQNIQDAQTFIDTPISTPPVDDDIVKTNIRNVGTTGRMRYDPEFALRVFSQSTGTPIQELLDRGYGERFGIEQPKVGTSTVGLPSLGLGQNLLTQKPKVSRQDVLTAANRLSDVAPAASVPLAPTSPFFDRDLLDDPLGLGIRTGFGPAVDAIEEGRARARAFPSAGTPVAGLPTIVPGAGGVLPDADPLAGDVIGAIRSGAAGLPFTNNPGALKQGQPDLTTEVVKSLPTGSRLTQDNLAPAIFNTLEAGIGGIDRQLSLYANNPNANITTPAALANTYLGSGNKENSPANRAAYIDAIKNVAGESFDLNNPTTRDNISKAIANQEFGSAGAQVIDDIRSARAILDDFNLDQLRLNEPLTSNVDQLGTLDPIGQTQTTSQIPDVLPDISQEFFRSGRPGGNIRSGTTQIGPGGRFTFSETPGRFLGTLGGRTLSPDVYSEGSFDIGDAPARQVGTDEGILPVGTFDVTESNRQRIDQEQRAIQDRGGRPTFNLGPGQPGVDIRGPLAARLASVLPDQALETLEGRRDIEPFALSRVGEDFDPALNIVDRREQAQRVQELLNRGQLAERDKMVQEMEAIDREPDPIDTANITETALGGRGTSPTTDLTRGPQVSIVGDDPIAPLETRDIVGDITQERVADILSRPDLFKDTFKIGDVEFPNLIATLANKAGSFFDRRLFDGIVKRGLDAVVDPDTGRIIGAKDQFGNLIEGRDLEGFKDTGGDPDPIGTFIKKATEDKEEEKDTTPNVIGGGTPRKTLENVPTVVSSPFQARDVNFRPVGFDAGNLNQLIERITGVPTPRRLQDGGQVQAVDRFLSKVA